MRAHGNLSFVYRLLGDLEPAVSHQQQAVDQAAALKDVFMEGRGNLDLAMTLRLRCAWLGWSSFPRQQPLPRPAPAPPPSLSFSGSLALPSPPLQSPQISPNFPLSPLISPHLPLSPNLAAARSTRRSSRCSGRSRSPRSSTMTKPRASATRASEPSSCSKRSGPRPSRASSSPPVSGPFSLSRCMRRTRSASSRARQAVSATDGAGLR